MNIDKPMTSLKSKNWNEITEQASVKLRTYVWSYRNFEMIDQLYVQTWDQLWDNLNED
jgi:hypothetical protein